MKRSLAPLKKTLAPVGLIAGAALLALLIPRPGHSYCSAGTLSDSGHGWAKCKDGSCYAGEKETACQRAWNDLQKKARKQIANRKATKDCISTDPKDICTDLEVSFTPGKCKTSTNREDPGSAWISLRDGSVSADWPYTITEKCKTTQKSNMRINGRPVDVLDPATIDTDILRDKPEEEDDEEVDEEALEEGLVPENPPDQETGMDHVPDHPPE